jgi:hypothetical protein
VYEVDNVYKVDSVYGLDNIKYANPIREMQVLRPAMNTILEHSYIIRETSPFNALSWYLKITAADSALCEAILTLVGYHIPITILANEY